MRPFLLDFVAAEGYAVFEKGTYNLNIIGLRTKGSDSNKFDDRICVVYKDENGWVTRTWEATCDPGLYWREKPMNVAGTAIMCEGQYRGAYKIGKHRGKYDALVQTGGRVTVWRDSNRYEKLDHGDPSDGYFGINIHKAGRESENVDKWSAGCQVFANESDFKEFMSICKKQQWPTFSYTLIEV